MARAKRTPAATDANADIASSKRASTNRVKSKGATKSSTTSAGKAKAMENDASLDIEKEKVVAASKEATPEAAEQTKPIDDKAIIPPDSDGKTWMCMCTQRGKTCGKSETCMCGRFADANPEHKWIVTMRGFELSREWGFQRVHRDQDYFGMYIFNDYSGYGTCEFMENMFLAYNKEVKKKKNQDVLAIWAQVEGMALFLNEDVFAWRGLSDSEGNAKRIMLIGTAFLTAIDILVQKGLFKNDNPEIRNIGLMMGYFLRFGQDVNEMCSLNEDGWKFKVLERAEEHNIQIQMHDVEQMLDEIRNSKESSNSDQPKGGVLNTDALVESLLNFTKCYDNRPIFKYGGVLTLESLKGEVRSWEQWNWGLELEAYSNHQSVKVGPGGPTYRGKIGGNFYDLTAKRNQGRHMKQYVVDED